MTTKALQARIPESCAGMRLDQALATVFNDYSRSRLTQWLKSGYVKVDGEIWRGRDKVWGGEQVTVQAELEEQIDWQGEDIPVDIRYEDEHILIVNKPAGLVVHPAAGNYSGTLVNALLHHDPSLSQLPRAGIVHRLDKDTTGLMVVARSLEAQKSLVEQLQEHSVLREYTAIVTGVMTAGGTVDEPVARHSVNRKRMGVSPTGKHAVTHYRVVERYRAHSLIRCRLETGRTHQIRVHMAHIRFPLVGDPTYGSRLKLPKGCSEELALLLRGFHRQALHAGRLSLSHPVTGKRMEWKAPLPEDMADLQLALQDDALQDESDDYARDYDEENVIYVWDDDEE